MAEYAPRIEAALATYRATKAHRDATYYAPYTDADLRLAWDDVGDSAMDLAEAVEDELPDLLERLERLALAERMSAGGGEDDG